VLYLFLGLLVARLVLSYVLALSRYRPTGYAAAAFETVYTITDVPLRPLDRILPVLRIGSFGLSLSFPILFLIVSILISQVSEL
jgi:YggT family protein